MIYCEDYIEPFAFECDHAVPHGINCDDCDVEPIGDDQEHWECACPSRCLMPSEHHRSECHTVEDAEAYCADVEGIAVK